MVLRVSMGREIRLQFEPPALALERWNPALAAKNSDAPGTLNIYSTIGEYGDGQGVTPKVVSDFLQKAEGKDVQVNVNSPGGDFFDGVAIHSLLKNYKGNVQVNIIGLAASAASVVAMAGSDIRIAQAGIIMVHNSWTIALGNKDDFAKVITMWFCKGRLFSITRSHS